MNKATLLASGPVLAFAVLCGYFVPRATTQTTTAAQTRAVVTATTTFLNSLDATQRQKVQFPFTPQKTATAARFARAGRGGGPGANPGGGVRPGGDGPDTRSATPGGQFGRGPDDGGPRRGRGGGPGRDLGGGFVGEQYGQAVWSNFPVSDVPRPGLTLGSLSSAQRGAAMHLLQVGLSSKGYRKVLDIMGSDQALADAGTPFSSGTAYYTIGIFGTPSATTPWMLEFGGHHLGLNITLAGEHGVMTPTLTGAQPAVYTSNGKAVRALADESDKAFALLNALDASQRKQAILNYHVDNLVLGPGHAGEMIQPEGLKASALNEQQRAMLLDLI